MDSSGTDELQAHVAAWHNRHRWAERIAPAQVSGVGVVSLPFQPGVRGGLGAKVAALWARLRDQPAPTAANPVAAFTEDFIAPLRRAAIERFARRHGGIVRPGAPDWPERQITIDANADSALIAPLYLQTACIEAGRRRRRVLIGVGLTPAVLGAHLLSARRIGFTAAMALTLGSTVTVASIGSGWFDGNVGASATAPAAKQATAGVSVADDEQVISDSSAAPIHLAAAAGDTHGMAKSAHSAAPVPSHDEAPSTSERNTPPADQGAAGIPSIRPVLSDAERAEALAEGRRLRAMKPSDVATASAVSPVPAVGSRTAGVTATRAPGPNAADMLYAVASLPLPTKALSQQRQRLIASSVEHGELPGKPRSEIMRTDAGWRVVLWPFNSRADANNARAMLGERGVPTEVLEF